MYMKKSRRISSKRSRRSKRSRHSKQNKRRQKGGAGWYPILSHPIRTSWVGLPEPGSPGFGWNAIQRNTNTNYMPPHQGLRGGRKTKRSPKKKSGGKTIKQRR